MSVELWTDGACSGNPGPGGWAAILCYGQARRALAGAALETTNNRMELLSVIEGLRALKDGVAVTVYSDSAYVVDAIEKKWIVGWQRKQWTNSKGDPVKNKDLWLLLLEQLGRLTVSWHRVKGHAGVDLNEQCDVLACQGRDAAKAGNGNWTYAARS